MEMGFVTDCARDLDGVVDDDQRGWSIAWVVTKLMAALKPIYPLLAYHDRIPNVIMNGSVNEYQKRLIVYQLIIKA